MQKTKYRFFYFIATRPRFFSILETLILLIGVGAGFLVYYRTNQIRSDSLIASEFDRQSNDILLAVTMAQIKFDNLMAGTSNVDIQKDVFSQLDQADDLCINIESGGPEGKFVPVQQDPQKLQGKPVSICDQLADFRFLLEQRWMDHQAGKPDTSETAYMNSLNQVLESMDRFSNVADPHILEAEQQTKISNIELSVGLTLVFFGIVLVLWRMRRITSRQTKELENEFAVSNRLNVALDSERNLLNTLLDALPDAVFAKDTSNKFLIVNPAAVRVLGREDKEDLIGKSEADFQPADISERILSRDAAIFQSGEPMINEQEIMIDLKNNEPRWRQTTKVALRDSTGKITGLVGISRDITKEKEIEEALKRSNEKLTAGISALEQTSRENERLSEMIDLLQACPNTEEACLVIGDQLGKFFPDDSGILYLFHASRNILDRASSWGPVLSDPLVFKPDDCWGLRRGRMHIVETDISIPDQAKPAPSLICPHIAQEGAADYLCVPLVAQGEALGLLHLRHVDKKGSSSFVGEWYTHAKQQRIHTIVDSLSLSLANLKLRSTLKQQSIRDPLTGMYNRRYMEETLEREILRAARNDESVGVIMTDIDHFKQFNDTFGHQAGDVLLQSLGHMFLTHVRGEDVACRFGGEEFILLLPGSTLEQTRLRAEELREKARHLNVTYQGQSLGTITLSFGVAVFPEHGAATEALVQSADQALYRAKTEGRDRVIVA